MTAAVQPNLLIVMCDQLTASLTGAYGHPVVRTPHLDRLAAGGVRFDAAYTPSPLCAPARASMMTGRHASSIGCYDNANALSSELPTFAHYLTNAGYDVALSGKMHFVGADQLHGFGRRLTTDIYPADFSWTSRRDAPHTNVSHDPDRVMATSYVTAGVRPWSMGLAYDEEVHFRALEYIRSRQQGTAPFCLCVSYHHPHDPFLVTQQMWDSYDGDAIEIPDVPEDVSASFSTMDRWLNLWHGVDRVDLRNEDAMRALRRSYYGLVSDIDGKLGDLLSALHSRGLRDDTVIVFLSDHGDMLGEKGMVQKRVFYEPSSRIPLIIEFPVRWRGGRSVRDPVSLIDLHPTLCEIAGVHDLEPHDGESLVPLLAGRTRPSRVVFSEMHADGLYAPCFMARSGRHKLIHVHGHDRQLFDLVSDPGEWRNLSGAPEHADVERGLLGAILERFDPEAIDRDVDRSIARRGVIREAMRRAGPHWDHEPRFDATTMYVRSR